MTLLNDRYRIIRILGSGGFGETYLAEDTHLPSSRHCVVKLLKPITNNPQMYQLVQERFQREAAILEELGEENPQIPKLYAYFANHGQFYLVQEYIEGQTLSQIVQQNGCLKESAVKEILINLLPVLEYLYSKRIVHRDIKPDNIILRQRDRQPVLIDFGAVRQTLLTVVSQGNSASSIVIGTPGFMPAEQAAGRAVFASDLYSLGLTAIYLLTAKLPQELQTDPLTGEIMWQRQSVSRNFAAILDQAIMSHSGARPTAAAMLQALQPQAEIQTTLAISKQQLPSSTPRTGWGDWQKAGIIGSVIAALAIAGLILIKPSQNQPQQTVQNPETPQQQVPSADNYFYFLADSAFSDRNNADAQLTTLKNAGYNKSGIFWVQNYPNLSGKPYHQVYVEKFSDRSSCVEVLKTYGQRNRNAYCALASQDTKAPIDRVLATDVIPQ